MVVVDRLDLETVVAIDVRGVDVLIKLAGVDRGVMEGFDGEGDVFGG